MNDDKPAFPIFASVEEAEAYSDTMGDAYYEVCYHLEGKLNLCVVAIHDLYANAPATKRPKMQTGVVREMIFPDGWPPHAETLIAILASCFRFQEEDTSQAYTVKEAMAALVLEKEAEGTDGDDGVDAGTLEAPTKAGAEGARRDLLRLCDWIESVIHHRTHEGWYGCPDTFCGDAEREHLATIGTIQRYLATYSERDRKLWEGIHARAAAKHQGDLKKWGSVGKAQHDPEPRTWTHPEVDARIIRLWPLVARHNWTYADLLKVLERLLPLAPGGSERGYPLDSVESLKVHCRSVCGLTKAGKGKTAEGLPGGWQIAEGLFAMRQ